MAIKFWLILLTCYVVVSSAIFNDVNDTHVDFEDLSEDEDFIDKRAIFTDIMPEWEFPIPYSVDKRMNSRLVDSIIENIEELTCITFTKVNVNEDKMIKFVKSGRCGLSHQKPERKVINVGIKCNGRGMIVQMLLKALGSVSEERRPDRDDFVYLKEENIMPAAKRYFKPYGVDQVDTENLRYDFGSILHNGRTYYSRNGKWTLVPRNTHYVKTIGQLSEIGFNDIKSLNMHYCSDTCDPPLDCENFGYTDPNDCTQCRCPRLYAGTHCEDIESSPAECGDTELIATKDVKTLDVSGVKSCVFRIEAPVDSIIQFKLVFSDLPAYDICPPNVGLEVKFQEDKSVSGPMFCGVQENVKLRSTSNIMVLKYVGLESTNLVSIEYNEV